jgi:hypothetical protein
VYLKVPVKSTGSWGIIARCDLNIDNPFLKKEVEVRGYFSKRTPKKKKKGKLLTILAMLMLSM